MPPEKDDFIPDDDFQELDPYEESSLLYKRGLNSYLSGNAADAEAAWGKAIKLNPGNREATRAFERIRPRPPVADQDSIRFNKDGLNAYLSGDKDKARTFWQEAIKRDRNNTEAIRGLERLQ